MRRLLPGLLFLTSLGACPGSGSSGGGGGDASGASGEGGSDAHTEASGDSSTQDARDSGGKDATLAEAGAGDAPHDVAVGDGHGAMPEGGIVHPCQLPGSVQFTSSGTVVLPGGSSSWPDLSFVKLPSGFCLHYFGTVPNARQVRFAPGGELFVASPTRTTTGGGQGGLNAIVVLPDDNLDGVADPALTFLSGMDSTQGLLFANGALYYQDGMVPTRIQRLPYAPGDRAPSGSPVQVADITVWSSSLHWPKTLDIADDGTIYVGNGGDQGETCNPAHPFHGGILAIDPMPGPNPGGQQVTKGLRNPITVRCARGHDRCFALELAKDYSASTGGREKLFPIRQGDDWGFPCCATTNLPYPTSPSGTDCSMVTTDTSSFLIGDTPIGLDFEAGHWPSPWVGEAFVATHGVAGSWVGSRIVAIPMDATTGLPMASSDTGGTNTGMADFATGWDDGTLKHGRAASIVFSSDGRLYVASDTTGVIFWIASMSM